MFDSVPISMCGRLKSVAIFGQNWTKIISIIDEKQHVDELIPMMKLG